jgi:hypothetical protein
MFRLLNVIFFLLLCFSGPIFSQSSLQFPLLLITDTTFLNGSTDQLFKKLTAKQVISLKRLDKKTFKYESDTLNFEIHYATSTNNKSELDNFYVKLTNKTQRELQSMVSFILSKTGNQATIIAKIRNSITQRIKLNATYNVDITNSWLYGDIPPKYSTVSLYVSKNSPSDDTSGYEIMDSWLSVGTADDEVLKKLGIPIKGKIIYSGALGMFIQNWTFTSIGTTIIMESDSENGRKRVSRNGITIRQPCQMVTSKNIRIGTKKEIVLQKYSKTINKEQSNPDSLIACGSIYNGTIFTISNDTVSKIFIGDAAE